MFRFEFIDSAASAYRFVVVQHQALYQMALVPFLIKLASFVLIVALNLDENFLRQGLVLLPSYFVEGWLVGKVLRFAVFGEIWPQALTGDPQKDAMLYAERSKALKATMIVYVLIKMVLALITSYALSADAAYQASSAASEDPGTVSMIIAVGLLFILLWSFRLLWLYIPVALGQSVKGFIMRLKSFSTSLYMLGTWFLCFIPVALLLLMVAQAVGSIFSIELAVEPPVAYTYFMVVVQAFVELLTAIVSSVAMAYTISALYKPK